MSEELRDRLDDFGLGLLEAADEERPTEASRDALLSAILGASAMAGGAALVTAKATASASSKAWLGSTAVAKWIAIGAAVTGSIALVNEVRTAQEVNAPPTRPASVVSAAPTPPAAPTQEIPVVAIEELATVTPVPSAAEKPFRVARTDSAPTTRVPAPEPTSENDSTDAPPAPRASLGDHVRLLDRARASLRDGDARTCLALLSEFDRRFGAASPLSPEAQLVRVEALLSAGDAAAARAARDALVRSHPTSIAARRATELVSASP